MFANLRVKQLFIFIKSLIITEPVSVKVDSATVLSFKVQETKDGKKSTKTDDIDMTTSYDAIIETSNIVDPTLDYHLHNYNSDVCSKYSANS